MKDNFPHEKAFSKEEKGKSFHYSLNQPQIIERKDTYLLLFIFKLYLGVDNSVFDIL